MKAAEATVNVSVAQESSWLEAGASAVLESLGPLPLWKRGFDIVIASALLVLLAPLLVVIALAVVADSTGSPLYRQVRVGRGGRRFGCWKFRSMQVGADRLREQLLQRNEANGHIFKIKADPRCTRVGRLLRRTSLDELPQLWNVLRGEMSLVGPRPPLPCEVELYEGHQMRRLDGMPGMTGLWQVRARNRHDFDEMVRLDVEYLRDVTLARDLKILLLTVPTVLLGHGSY